jgi:hypothetical protein
MARPARIELASSEWHSEALPIDQGRMVGVPRIELGMHIGAGFTDPLSHQTWRHPIGCSGPNRTAYLVGMSHASCQCSTLRQGVRGFQLTRLPPLHPWSAEIGGSLTCRSPCLSALIRFERRPEAAPVRLPKMAEDCELESHTREGASRFPSGAGAPARLIFQIGGERAQSKPMPLPAPLFSKQRRSPDRFTLLVGRHDRTRTCILRPRKPALIQLSYVTLV